MTADFAMYLLIGGRATVAYDAYKRLPLKGTIDTDRKKFYIRGGEYRVVVSNLSTSTKVELSYPEQVNSNDPAYALPELTSVTADTHLANAIYPGNGRLCTLEDLFSIFHKDNKYYLNGYYLMRGIKDRVIPYKDALAGINVKLFTGYQKNLIEDNMETLGLYEIDYRLTDKQQTPPKKYYTVILDAIRKWTSLRVNTAQYPPS